ncbi:Cro/C1-type HTH DNA-binding domain protein [Streptococcus sp. AS20]|uniref:helix-turn-helix domain-containing protein n=1 Tax=Streptococcus sp. AS20 TaxID=936578 RepID=UPI00044EE396|nr:helix-turn-helix transcriptional regulator [Streptococcus sp. AS20]EUB22734.1 Cro/C1-type HTH DNA-binding domain protein [Streptococcus sp. AS20]
MSKLSYKKLFKKLIDIEMKNTELMEKAKVSKSTFYKIKNGENVTTDVLLRICDVLECDISDIVECVEIEDK